MDALMTRSVPDGAAMLEPELSIRKPDGFIVGGSVKAFVAARGPTANGMSVSMIERSLPSDYGSCSLPYSPPSNVTTVTVDGSRSPLRFIDDKPSLPKSLAINKPQVPEKKPALLKAVASGLRRSESMKETGSTPSVSTLSTQASKSVIRRPPKAKYSLPTEVNEETKYYSLPRRGKSGSSSIKRSSSNCSLKSVDGAGTTKRVEEAQVQQPSNAKPSRQLPQPPTATATLDPKKLRPPRASPPDSASLSRSPKRSPPVDNNVRRLERVSSTASISNGSIYATLPRNKAKTKVKPHSPERFESGRDSAASSVSTVSTVASAPRPPPKPVHLTPSSVVARRDVSNKSGTLPRNMGRMKKADSDGRVPVANVAPTAAACAAKTRSASTPRTTTNRVQSPGLRNRKETAASAGMTSKSPSPASKPPRAVIYIENATQTLLTLEDIQAALVRASTPSSCNVCDVHSSVDEQPKSITIERPVEDPASDKPDVWSKTCEVGVQAEINFYDPNKAYTVADTQNLLKQLRKLTEEHSKLEANYARLRSAVGEVDRLKTELRKMQATLEEEVAIKNEVQQELDQTSSRVQSMLSSLEGVEKEFTTRGNSLADLEAQLELAQRTMLNQQMEIETSQNIIFSLQQDLEKSISAQKTLFQQLQETESESRELQDFLQSEKNTLQDALREAEKTMLLLRSQMEEKERLLHEQTLRCNRLMQLSSVEERRMCSSPFEERGVGDGIDGDQDSVSVTSSAKEMLLHQGAQLSSSAVALENLSFKISAMHRVVSETRDAKQKQEDWQSTVMCDLLKKLVGPEEYEALMDASQKTPALKNTRQKQPLLFDDVNDELDDDLNVSKTSTLNSSSSNMLESVIEEDEELDNGEESVDENMTNDKLDQPEAKADITVDSGRSLSEQVTQIDGMLSEFLKCVLTIGASTQRRDAQWREEREELLAMCHAKDHELATLRCAVGATSGITKMSSVVNGANSPNAIDKKSLDHPCFDKPDQFVLAMKSEMSRMKLKLLEKDAEMREKEERHARHAQILLENWRRAEAELSRLDDAMDRVVLTLQSVPEVVTTCPALKKLLIELGSLNCGIPFKSPAINGAGPSSSPINGKKHSSPNNGTLLEADELETVID